MQQQLLLAADVLLLLNLDAWTKQLPKPAAALHDLNGTVRTTAAPLSWIDHAAMAVRRRLGIHAS